MSERTMTSNSPSPLQPPRQASVRSVDTESVMSASVASTTVIRGLEHHNLEIELDAELDSKSNRYVLQRETHANSGKLLYFAVVNGSTSESDKWRIRRDAKTSKTFYTNSATGEKRWKLPTPSAASLAPSNDVVPVNPSQGSQGKSVSIKLTPTTSVSTPSLPPLPVEDPSLFESELESSAFDAMAVLERVEAQRREIERSEAALYTSNFRGVTAHQPLNTRTNPEANKRHLKMGAKQQPQPRSVGLPQSPPVPFGSIYDVALDTSDISSAPEEPSPQQAEDTTAMTTPKPVSPGKKPMTARERAAARRDAQKQPPKPIPRRRPGTAPSPAPKQQSSAGSQKQHLMTPSKAKTKRSGWEAYADQLHATAAAQKTSKDPLVYRTRPDMTVVATSAQLAAASNDKYLMDQVHTLLSELREQKESAQVREQEMSKERTALQLKVETLERTNIEKATPTKSVATNTPKMKPENMPTADLASTPTTARVQHAEEPASSPASPMTSLQRLNALMASKSPITTSTDNQCSPSNAKLGSPRSPGFSTQDTRKFVEVRSDQSKLEALSQNVSPTKPNRREAMQQHVEMPLGDEADMAAANFAATQWWVAA